MEYRFRSIDELKAAINSSPMMDSWIEDYQVHLENKRIPQFFYAELVESENNGSTTVRLIMPDNRTKLLIELDYTMAYKSGALSERFTGLHRKELKIRFHREDEIDIEFRLEE